MSEPSYIGSLGKMDKYTEITLTGCLIDVNVILCWDRRKNWATDVGGSNKFYIIK